MSTAQDEPILMFLVAAADDGEKASPETAEDPCAAHCAEGNGICREDDMRMKVLVIILVMLAVTVVAEAPEVETTNGVADLVYRIDDNGAIYDEKGGLMGWIKGDTVYNANWGPRYMVGARGTLREIESGQ